MSENKREDSIEVYKGLEFEVTWGDINKGKQWGRAVSGDIEFSVTRGGTYPWWVGLCSSGGYSGEVCGVGDTFSGAIERALTSLRLANKDARRLRDAVRNA